MRRFLSDLFQTAVAAAHPAQCLPRYLPEPPAGRLIVLAGGKAAGAMAETAERIYLQGLAPDRLDGLAVTRHGYGRPTQRIPVIEAGHPVPDDASRAAAARTLDLAGHAGPDDLVLALISGGASANWVAPVPGLTFAEKQAVTRALLRSGATISEMNTVRKHLSRIKGGRLARVASPTPVVTLAISDVPGDDPAIIGSGPTVPDPSTLSEARAIVTRYKLDLPATVIRALNDPDNETPKPGDAVFNNTRFTLIARPADAFRAAEAAARAAGYDCVFLGDQVEGEAREIAAAHAKLARDLQAQGKRTVILSGGELTVTIRGSGRGGPNQEYALALVAALDGTEGIAALSGDTDGTDGGGGSADDPAGAFADGTSAGRARSLGLDPAAFLTDNDSTGFFSGLGDLLQTGPTFTNVNDFRAIVVDRP
ncbi:MAG TPA: glycerate kinase [Pseudolabrys sp.]|nr:glycerate kinase [Pseudolabrys sp.]